MTLQVQYDPLLKEAFRLEDGEVYVKTCDLQSNI
jgi:hypothetical protein